MDDRDRVRAEIRETSQVHGAQRQGRALGPRRRAASSTRAQDVLARIGHDGGGASNPRLREDLGLASRDAVESLAEAEGRLGAVIQDDAA
jgi:hypothetical protein